MAYYRGARSLFKKKRQTALKTYQEVGTFDLRRDHPLVDWQWRNQPAGPLVCLAGKTATLEMRLTNRSTLNIPAGGLVPQFNQSVMASYQMSHSRHSPPFKQAFRQQLPRSVLPRDAIAPGIIDHVDFTMKIYCPLEPGAYFARLELIQEGVTWWHLVTDPARQLVTDVLVLPSDIINANLKLALQNPSSDSSRF